MGTFEASIANCQETASRISNYSSVSREPGGGWGGGGGGTSLLSFLQSKNGGGSMNQVLGWPGSQLLSHGIVNEMKKKNEGYLLVYENRFMM